MTAWTREELTKIAGADELEIASLRRDGTLGSPRTIWVVRVDDDLFVLTPPGGSVIPDTVANWKSHVSTYEHA